MKQKREITANTRQRWLLLALVAGLGVLGIYHVRFDTGRYTVLEPVWRWKFAIYTGECDDETGCHFEKMPGTGLLEYVGLKEIPGLEAEQLARPSGTDSLPFQTPTGR